MFGVLFIWNFSFRDYASADCLMVGHASSLVDQIASLSFFPVIFPHYRLLSASASGVCVVGALDGRDVEAFVSVEDITFPYWDVLQDYHEGFAPSSRAFESHAVFHVF